MTASRDGRFVKALFSNYRLGDEVYSIGRPNDTGLSSSI